jgi:UDP-glucose 4-epimerase
MSILVMGSAAYIRNHTCVKIRNSAKSVVAVASFSNSKPESIHPIHQTISNDFQFYAYSPIIVAIIVATRVVMRTKMRMRMKAF